MVTLLNMQSGYDAVGEYVQKYWSANKMDTVIVLLGTSYNGCKYNYSKEVAFPSDDFNSVCFLNDWWEGEKFIQLLGIKLVDEIDISD